MLNPFAPNPFQMPGAGSMFDTPPQTLEEFLANPTPLGPMAGSSPGLPGGLPHDVGYGFGGNTMRFNPQAQLDPSQVNLWLGDQNPWNGWMDRATPWGVPTPQAWFDSIPQRRFIPGGSGGINPFAGPGQYEYVDPGNTYPWGPAYWENFR